MMAPASFTSAGIGTSNMSTQSPADEDEPPLHSNGNDVLNHNPTAVRASLHIRDTTVNVMY
jgi:hypothetical protein